MAHLEGLISEKELQYLFNSSPTKPVFYILPKVHKDKKKSSWMTYSGKY